MAHTACDLVVVWSGWRLCVCLVFAIPLHAARRAMAAVCRCHGGQRAHFPAFNHTVRVLSPTIKKPYWGALISFPLPRNKGKEKAHQKQNKGKRENRTPRPHSPASMAVLASPHSSLASTSASPTPSLWATEASYSGASGAAALFSLRGKRGSPPPHELALYHTKNP